MKNWDFTDFFTFDYKKSSDSFKVIINIDNIKDYSFSKNVFKLNS